MSEWDRIVADLQDKENIDRAVAACKTLDQAADESRLPELYRLLAEGRDSFVREAAAVPIARLEGLRALPELLQALVLGEEERHDNDGLVSIVLGLVQADPEKAAPVLIRMIHGPTERERADAAWLWGFVARALTAEPLLALLKDPSPRVRAEAVGSLGSFKGREDVFACLVQALEDPDEGVKCSAASALGFYGDRRAMPPLHRMLSSSSQSVQRMAQGALERLGKGEWRPTSSC
jgi:bilin biosynthesis protein